MPYHENVKSRTIDVHVAQSAVEKPVSLAPLKTGEAIKGLFAIPDPEAAKPPKRKKKTPPPSKE
jgi:hypothetical protein